VNTDRTNIGSHVCVCNKPLGSCTIGFDYSINPAGWVDRPIFGSNNTIDMIIMVSGTPPAGGSTTCTVLNSGGLATVGSATTNDLSWSGCSSCSGASSTAVPVSGASFSAGVLTANNVLSYSSPTAGFFLVSNNLGNVTVASGADTRWVNVRGAPTAVTDMDKNNAILIYPTLANDAISVKSNDKIQYNIISLDGKKILSGNIKESLESVDITRLTTGTYYFEFIFKNGFKNYAKFIKQ
jgi:hypothetical protein